jgi:hypothetical protein
MPAPLINITYPQNTTYSSNNTWFNATANKALTWMYVNWGAGNNTMTNAAGNWYYQNSSMPDGIYTAIFYANDTAGNQNKTNVTFTIDTTKPIITLNAPANNTNTTNNWVLFNFTATDNLAATTNCTLYINNSANATNSSTANNTATTFNITNIAHGTYQWYVNCTDSANNTNTSTTRQFFVNQTPILTSVSASQSPIKGGNVITIAPSGVGDPQSDSLNYYCSLTSSIPTSSNSNCSQGSTLYTNPYSSMTCTFATALTDQSNTIYCRVYDGTYYSSVASTTFTTASTPPITAINNVAGDTAPTYYDNLGDGWTNITIDGEAGMLCRYYTSDSDYNPALGTNCTTVGTQAICSPTTTIEGLDAYNFYVSCADSLGNGQNTTQNLDITALVTDWTAPNTADNSSTTIAVPPYTVMITESDNLFSSATITTKYCTDTSGSCTPNTAIDSGETVTFTSSNRGTNFLRYNSSDPAGNVQTIQNKTININQLPVFTSASDNATTIKGGSGVLISTVSSDADSGQTMKLFVCNSTSASYAGCTGGTYCSNISAGANATCEFVAETDDTTHTWYAFLYDSLNESATTNHSGSYTTDSTAPIVTIINPQNQTYSETSVSAQLVLSETGSWAGYSLDGDANVTMINSTPTFWSAAISSLSNGAHTVIFYANDSYNNMANSITRYFSIDTTQNDTTPPTITVWSPTNGTYYTSASVLANMTLSEAGSNATYSLNGTANVSMGNISTTSWNLTLTLSDGLHNITFYANDSSTNKNTGNSSTIYFYVDTQAPQNVLKNNTPISPNDTVNIACYSQWTDNIGLDYGYLEHNETGTAVNSSQISLSGTSDWINYTVDSTNTTPSIIQCKAYAFDKAGLVNTSSWTITVTDATSPIVENISYLPNTAADLDPNVMVNVTANVSDNVGLSSVLIQYKLNTSDSWTESIMSQVAGSMYRGNFIPAAGNYSFRIFANDTSNNTNTSSIMNISVNLDKTWINVTTIPATKSIVQTQPRVVGLGNVTINNTGDFDLNFTVTSDRWIILNGTNTSLNFIVNSSFNYTTFNVTANATGFAVGSYPYSITINSYTVDSTLVSSQTLNGTVVVQNVAGPYFVVSITTYDATVAQGDTNVNLSASLENAGTGDATGTWIAWSLPSGWTNTSGMLNKSIDFLGIGSTVTNDMIASISDSATTGSQSLQASAGSSEGITGSDSKTVTVSSPTPTQTVTTTVTTGGGGVSTATLIEKVLAGKEILNSSETFELVRGYSNSFPVTVKNIFSGTTLENVSIKIEGLLSQYMSFSPTMIDKIAFDETKQFNVTIMSPEYMEKGTHELSIIVTGKIVGPGIKRDFTDTRSVNLIIHTVSEKTANMSLEQAIADINKMEKAGFPVVETSKLLEQAKQALSGHDYDGAKDISDEIEASKENAFNAYNTMQELRSKISTYRSISKIFNKSVPVTGLFSFPTRFSETENVVNLAQAAFEREDFATALQRTKDAQMTFALERGNFNLIYFLVDYWWEIILSVAVLSISGIFGYQIYIKSTITQKITNLKKEEDNIRKLIIETQKKHFKEKSIGVETFHKNMSQFQNRLSKIMQSRVELRHKRTRLLKPQKVIKDLDEERKEIENLLKNLQKDYFVKHKVSRAAYEDQAKVYNERLAEIEDEQLTLETKLHMEGKKK